MARDDLDNTLFRARQGSNFISRSPSPSGAAREERRILFRRDEIPRDRSRKLDDRRQRHSNRSRSPSRTRRHYRSRSQDEVNRSKRHREHHSRRRRSRERDRQSRSRSVDRRRSKKPLQSQQDAFDSETAVIRKSPQPEKEKPNFGNTGRLAAESNTIKSVEGQSIVLKYHEPPEARKPSQKDAWRMYVFKDSDVLETVELSSRSCWLFGREHSVADFPIDHPSCSKQHAVIQFRYIEKKNEYGDRMGKVKPYIIDLESANGTKVNGDPAPAKRYFELMDKDVIKFGLSTREYVLMLPPPP